MAGEVDLEGDIFTLVRLGDVIEGREGGLSLGRYGLAVAWRAARQLGALGPPLPAPPEGPLAGPENGLAAVMLGPSVITTTSPPTSTGWSWTGR